MATRDDQEALRLLVQYVSRAFYEPKFVVIMDQLARHPVLKDDELAGRIGLQAKELNKLMAVLTNDRLVHIYRQNELRDGTQRSVGRQYYFIDYQHFCNVVKWRVTEMRRIIDSTLRNELDNKGYICPNCKATYSPLEADRLLDYMLGTLVCDQCRTSPGGPHEVILNEDEEAVRGSKDRMERFNRQTKFIREGLRRSEAMTLPAFDVVQWVKNNTVEDRQKQAGQNGGLKIAGADGKQQEQNIGVVLSVDKDEATRRREREEEAEMKRQQNALPSWHLKSTISNDLTALGVAAQNAKVSANEAILSSLGKTGGSNTDILNGLGKATPQVKAEQTEVTVVEEKKPEVDHTADFYEQYYASLEAASQAQSSAPTPLLESLGGDFDRDEQKPDMAYLDSLNASGKRSRSPDDLGLRENKALRSSAGTPVFSRSGSTAAISNALEHTAPFATSLEITETVVESMEVVEEPPTDDPMVLVGGQPMPFSQVTQEIADERMSAEEYTAWYELMMATG